MIGKGLDSSTRNKSPRRVVNKNDRFILTLKVGMIECNFIEWTDAKIELLSFGHQQI